MLAQWETTTSREEAEHNRLGREVCLHDAGWAPQSSLRHC